MQWERRCSVVFNLIFACRWGRVGGHGAVARRECCATWRSDFSGVYASIVGFCYIAVGEYPAVDTIDTVVVCLSDEVSMTGAHERS